MTPTENLIHEHEAIRVMLSIMSKIAENIRDEKEFVIKDILKIVGFLKTFADKCHHGKEETALFPALVLAGISNENGPIGVMLKEHAIGRKHINEISSEIENFKAGQISSSYVIATSLINYVNLLHNHILKEENILFPLANKVLTEDIQKEILKKFKETEGFVLSHGAMERYNDLLEQLKNKYLS